MAIYVYWFLLALILLGLEMATGTFYLLVISIAMAAGGVVALLGMAMPGQLAIAALAGVAGIVLLRRRKVGSSGDAGSQSLDDGQPVKVLTWREDGTARVFYRGAEWDAELATGEKDHDGQFIIKSIHGSILVLTKQKPN
jgi:membrane protein implicated in regulation of membrane protease activity